MKGTAWFLVLCFGFAWGWWEAVLATGVSVLDWRFQLYVLPGAFAPAIAAFVVRKWITREGFADAGLRLNLHRWPYYLFAWLLPLLVVAVIVAEATLMGIGQPDFTLERAIASGIAGRDLRAADNPGLLIVPQVMMVALLSIPLLWGEEFGWRGYLQIRLFADRPVVAAIATGLIWAVWHFPLTLRGYNYPDAPVLGSLLFVPVTITISYILGWIRARTGSIWATSLGHAATNAIGGLALLWLAGTAGPLMISYAGVLALPPLLLVCVALFLSSRRIGRGSPLPHVDPRVDADDISRYGTVARSARMRVAESDPGSPPATALDQQKRLPHS